MRSNPTGSRPLTHKAARLTGSRKWTTPKVAGWTWPVQMAASSVESMNAHSPRTIVWMQVSLDGFTQGPNGEFDWPQVQGEVHQYFVDTLRDAGTFVYGRNVFEMMASYWPTADVD